MSWAQCPWVHFCCDSFKPVCWPAGGQASEEARDGGAWRWPLPRPLWWSLSFHGNSGPECYWLWGRLNANARNVSTLAQNTKRLFWYAPHLNGISFFFHSISIQILEYEDYKNDTESEYEEYELYEDSFEFAERERAETWDGEVNLKVNSHIKWVVTSSIAWVKWFLTSIHLFLLLRLDSEQRKARRENKLLLSRWATRNT